MLCLQEFCNTVCGGCSVVAANGYKKLDVVVLEQGQVEVVFKILVGGFEAAHLQVAAATVEVCVGLEEINVLRAGRLREKPAVTAVKADYAITVGEESLCNRHNDGIHARCRAAATKDNDGIFHIIRK